MVEIHRSRLYYARACALLVLPGFRKLTGHPVMVIVLDQAKLLLEPRGGGGCGDIPDSDRLIAHALKAHH